MNIIYSYLLEHLRSLGLTEFLVKPTAAFTCILLIVFVAWFAHFVTRKIFLKIVQRIAARTKTEWDDILVRNKVFMGLAHLVPAFILFYTADFSYPNIHTEVSELDPEVYKTLSQDYYWGLATVLLKMSRLYFTVIIVYVTNAILNAGLEIYNTTEYAHHRSIKGYVQLVKIFVFFMAGILVISVLLEKDPTVLLAGLGAMAAVLLLVFRDTILGFVASIQLSANDMVKIGDWIQMDSHRADGTVIDITLNTVKVQNWDKTITTIPTYALVSESFYNWKGMEESGGRRIKRSVAIDTNTIKFCDAAMLERFEKFDLIRGYVREKEQELKEYNKGKNLTDEDFISGRHQTNVGIFRKYLEVYLRQHPKIKQDLTFLVRQLAPVGKGLPIEIYVFSNDQAWANYEAIQADIFDHIFAVIPEFELRVFQEPTGADLEKLIKRS
ncbi:mechanosensitive ion channel [Draconibacterium sp. IB214405]|uniref:mechanosensitive ion channel family protein n=1 Tax=Draconibacterium sp. IB214405 TaxID=3097352 RepID=UPI002A14B414|nr:mechanosensitive ion channel domain-containing protein [Draconibacterium sp. IB214405]MDX8341187.1 mechanosensitive ion channel [Draconibacterium sp. IB214405]